ncbi:hypothetical protein BDV32DRAFT_147987 [Aspergillus pseudonomiae]|nr:hypothetical protein BDV32DRAFT_147987 [Aspergillus pseudonomiae]
MGDLDRHALHGDALRATGEPIALPPNTNLTKFRAFISRVTSVVDETNVQIILSDDDIAQEEYTDPSRAHDMFHILDKTHFISSAVVAPKNVADVQEIIKLANKFEVPVWPFSKGRNIGYGGTAPRVRGSLGIDLGKNMNRVLKVDPQSAYALLETGVSYFDPHEYLVTHNLRDQVWADVPDVGGGSVIGNALERGTGYTPYGEHWMMHCGLKVVLPDGSLRTGMGALPNPKADKSKPPHEQEPNESWQIFDCSLGPHSAGIFSQSSLGIVVKMGILLLPNPGGYQAYMVTFPRDNDLNQIVEILRPLRISGVIQNTPKLDNVLVTAAVQSHRTEYTTSNKPLTDCQLDEVAKKLSVGRWNLYGAMYGPPVIRDALWSVINASFSKIHGAKFYFPEDRPTDTVLQTRSNTMQGIPSTTELGLLSWLPNGGHLFFSPIAKVTGPDANAQYGLTRRLSEEYRFDFIGVFIIGAREMHHIVCILFDRKDPDARRRAHKLIQVLIAEAADRGWGEYSAHLALMDQIAQT